MNGNLGIPQTRDRRESMKTCAFCGEKFEAKRSRLCCTRSCSAKLSMAKKGKSAWTQEEEDFLSCIAGSYPFPKLVNAFNKWAVKSGYPKRSDTAIAIKIKRSTLSRKCTEDNFTVYELARGLGVSKDRIRSFVKNRKLRPKKVARNQYAISRKDAIQLVIDYPEYFSSCDRENLFWLLEDDRLVDQVRSVTPSARGYRKPVRCYSKEGIKVYSGVKEAARDNYLTHSCIIGAIARNGKSGGMRWEYC